MSNFDAICMSEEYWANSMFSVVRHTGEISIGGHVFIIVNQDGKDIFQCSHEADKAGRQKAIEPGEPADLVRRDFVKYYRRLKRDRFLQVLRDNPTATDKELQKIYKDMK